MKSDPNFLSGCRRSILDMREAGMSEARIACALTEIRAAAIFEERLRLEALLRANPPTHQRWGDVVDDLEEQK